MRLPPQNLEAEQAILGSLLLDRESWDQISDAVQSSDFYKPSHQVVFEAIRSLYASNSPVDLITVSNFLNSEGKLDQIGGSTFLVDLVNKTVSTANLSSYAKIVKEKSLLRKLISTTSKITDRAYSEDFTDVETFMDQAENEIFTLSDGSTQQQGLVGPMEIVKSSVIKIEELYKQKSDITGLPTGFTFLDKMTSGFQAGDLIIVAARPSMGKSAFSLNIAQHMALRHKKTVAYFSLEMSKESLMMRLLASEARINIKDIRSGKVPDYAWPKLIQIAGQVSECKLFIDETSGISPVEIRSRVRRLKAMHGIDAIVIDYLQLMDLKQKVESRERAVSEISKSLKSLAKELQIPVVALAQLNRGVEGRSDRRPMLSDLRESGSIEQDADVIMMLYRDDYYDKEDPEKHGRAEVIIGKQRNGPTGTVKLHFEAEYGRFKDAESEISHPLPPPPPQQFQYNQKPKNFAPGVNT
jgi:replicative DNA helicase